jgi:hypothetical protein
VWKYGSTVPAEAERNKRAFYANNLVVQGFELRSLGNISNPENRFLFKDSLEVLYKYKTIPNRYRVLSKDNKHETFSVSQFVFINKRPVYILSSGYHYKPNDLKITGYWAWSENMSTLLPFDYRPH